MGQTFAGALFALSLSASGAALAAETYGFDVGHTEIRFVWNHAGISTQSGEFRAFDGSVTWDRENLANSKVEVTIPASSIDTGVSALDDHLKAGDFFDVENHPEITFTSTEVRQSGVDRGIVTGDLTIRGVTKPVTLDVALVFDDEHPFAAFMPNYEGAHYAGFSARGRVLRSDFGLDRGVPLVSDWIDIVIETEMRRQD
ncbi:MAG: YceI family protein [Kiloniellales bacterium]